MLNCRLINGYLFWHVFGTEIRTENHYTNDMFKRFLIESFRAKKHRPLSFIINWLGLTLGFAAVIVMYIFIMGQVRHDSCFSRPMIRFSSRDM